jgi:hypothetical protein
VSERILFDTDAYERRTREGLCFVCAVANGDLEYRRTSAMIYEDPNVLGHLAPRQRGR